MKRILGVALLLVSFASVALADGSGPPPKKSTTTKPAVADTSNPQPIGTAIKLAHGRIGA
ncbi:MAG: hypothetical protein JWQ87_706 [Candidatus Sulfotelmatobacter sp.]|nr:hypothetical protein [Candidatus Sulfotelmatobacter sp.]